MNIPFVKLHGAKNDFLLTGSDDAPEGVNLPDVAIAICDRYTGVGADGWMLIDTRQGPGYDASIRLFNSDGSEPELSGNGTRCAAALILRARPDAQEVRIRTGAGVKTLRLISLAAGEYLFEMNMGTIAVRDLHAPVQELDAVIVDAGNPQCAVPVENFEMEWRRIGAAIERDSQFPNRTNVSFVKRVDAHTIDVRFWERGAGETNSSGTGSTGAAAAAQARGLVESPVTVLTPAGPLNIRIEGPEFYLTGPAEIVADGVFYVQELPGDRIRNLE